MTSKVLTIIFAIGMHMITASHAAEKASADAQEAQKILQPLKMKLLGTLQTELAKNGPEGAVGACHLEAPKIASDIITQNKQQKITVGRSSHKTRSPKNAPKDWMKPVIEQYLNTQESDWVSGKIAKYFESHTKSGYRYAEPIYVKEMCLTCHGQNVAASLQSKISSLYPEDKATGFELGQFRGIVWLEKEK